MIRTIALTILIAAGALVVIGAGADLILPAPPIPVFHLPPPEPIPEPLLPLVPALDPRIEALRIYTREALESWPGWQGEAISADDAALSIARAAVDDHRPYNAAMTLAGLAFMESHLAKYVDSGDCNRWLHEAWRHGHRRPNLSVLTKEAQHALQAYGTCDGGFAYSIWQIHPTSFKVPVHEEVTARKLADRDYAAKIALRIARIDSSLCAYAGEAPQCPKATERRMFIDAELRKHPPPGI